MKNNTGSPLYMSKTPKYAASAKTGSPKYAASSNKVKSPKYSHVSPKYSHVSPNYSPVSPKYSASSNKVNAVNSKKVRSFNNPYFTPTNSKLFGNIIGLMNTLNTSRNLNLLSNSSAHGIVWEFRDKPYILKQVKNIRRSQIPAFMSEVKIGSLNRTRNFGPVILAHRIYQQPDGKYTGEFIMENLFKMFPSLETMTLSKYLKEYFPNSCPSRESNFYKKLSDTLFNFYKISGSYHGDMHEGNVYVFLNPKTKKVEHVKLIDYGSTFPIRNKNKLKSLRCLSDILKQINEQHKENVKQIEQRTGRRLPNWPRITGAKYFVPRGYMNSVRSNLNLMTKVWRIKNKNTSLRRLESAFKNKVNVSENAEAARRQKQAAKRRRKREAAKRKREAARSKQN